MRNNGPLADSAVFNVRYNATLKLDRVYRVYLTHTDLYFVRIGGQFWGAHESLPAAGHGVGFIGALIAALLATLLSVLLGKRARKKHKELFQTIDRIPPEQLLDRHKHNFKLTPADFKDSLIEPPSLFAPHGLHAGRWKSVLRDGRKLNLELLTDDDMCVALSLLPYMIGPALKVNAKWNWRKQKYTKQDS